MDLLARIDHWGTVAPDRPAHISEGRTLTYGELRAQSDALASWLSEKLGDNRAPIAVIGHKENEMLVAFLGAVKSGRPYVPIDLSIPPQRAERIVQNAGAALTLTPAAVREALAAPRATAKPKPVTGEDPYYIIFTSGSTGEPKGVVITLNCLTTFVIWTLGEQKFPELDETFLNQAPFSFDLSVMDLYSSLASGGTLFSITKEAIANPKVLYQAFTNSSITTWVSTPSFAQMCLVEKTFGPAMLPQIRRFWFCGETLANETAAQLLDRFPDAEVWNTYGPTEATVATTSMRVDRKVIAEHAPLPVGYEMPGTRIVIMDEKRASVPEGERGEIVIIGPNVSPGYLGRADLTEKAFFATDGTRAYRTGDWGRMRGGLVFFEGRMDGQIKLHGYRIEIGDIESHLRNLPQISDAVVLVVEKNGKPDSLAGFVVLRERGAGSDFEISLQFKKQLAERLPAYMVPRKFWFLEAFPMTANGKADRRKLAELLK
ncbi:MAG: D-alanine--poly(phosphoribitol) ligase subunit DltA [Chthoniobacter sp.]|uniref:D-alanine--poly(phosphoribitol) ligase subunit DltA n=1 Tax=Chthoniobacter sp. TaxID=2510640 RepID=UPI0032A80F94